MHPRHTRETEKLDVSGLAAAVELVARAARTRVARVTVAVPTPALAASLPERLERMMAVRGMPAVGVDAVVREGAPRIVAVEFDSPAAGGS